jgi:hypothetical protein
MNRRNLTGVFAYLGLHLLLLAFTVFPTILLAAGKEHPVQGTGTGLGTSEETTGGGTTPVFTYEHRTYTVKQIPESLSWSVLIT